MFLRYAILVFALLNACSPSSEFGFSNHGEDDQYFDYENKVTALVATLTPDYIKCDVVYPEYVGAGEMVPLDVYEIYYSEEGEPPSLRSINGGEERFITFIKNGDPLWFQDLYGGWVLPNNENVNLGLRAVLDNENYQGDFSVTCAGERIGRATLMRYFDTRLLESATLGQVGFDIQVLNNEDDSPKPVLDNPLPFAPSE